MFKFSVNNQGVVYYVCASEIITTVPVGTKVMHIIL